MARVRSGDSAGGSGSDWVEMYRWVQWFFDEKLSPRLILKWMSWARGRFEAGWSLDAVKDRIKSSWDHHARNLDSQEMDADLKQALTEVHHAAEKGWTPAQCAVVYRSLYRVHPTRHWLAEWAYRWEQAGSDWKAVKFPDEMEVG